MKRFVVGLLLLVVSIGCACVTTGFVDTSSALATDRLVNGSTATASAVAAPSRGLAGSTARE